MFPYEYFLYFHYLCRYEQDFIIHQRSLLIHRHHHYVDARSHLATHQRKENKMIKP